MPDGMQYVAWREENIDGIRKVYFLRSDGKKVVANFIDVLPFLQAKQALQELGKI